MNEYQASFVFFTYTEDEKNRVVNGLDGIADITDIYLDSDGDWNIECETNVSIRLTTNTDVFTAIDKKLSKVLKKVKAGSWDYHYIKGINNDYYWQP